MSFSSSALSIDAQIAAVNEKIDKVETDIAAAATKWEEATAEKVQDHWSKKEEQLREEKKQLRKDKEQLREEKKQLREKEIILLKQQQPQPKGKLFFTHGLPPMGLLSDSTRFKSLSSPLLFTLSPHIISLSCVSPRPSRTLSNSLTHTHTRQLSLCSSLSRLFSSLLFSSPVILSLSSHSPLTLFNWVGHLQSTFSKKKNVKSKTTCMRLRPTKPARPTLWHRRVLHSKVLG
jgi:hypothetical protein